MNGRGCQISFDRFLSVTEKFNLNLISFQVENCYHIKTMIVILHPIQKFCYQNEDKTLIESKFSNFDK